MAVHNSLVMTNDVIATIVADVSARYPSIFPHSSSTNTIRKIRKRLRTEGIGFITKTLPHLRKSLDQALSGQVALDPLRFERIPGTQLPKLFGELFQRVLNNDGWIIPNPCVTSIRLLRQVLDLYYKYELPYDKKLEEKVVVDFQEVDRNLPEPPSIDAILQELPGGLLPDAGSRSRIQGHCHVESPGKPGDCDDGGGLGRVGDRNELAVLTGQQSVRFTRLTEGCQCEVVQSNAPSARSYDQADEADAKDNVIVARRLLKRLLCNFDPHSITPRHGPGVVSTGEKPFQKMQFRRFYKNLDAVYPYAEYFYSGTSHLCDEMHGLFRMEDRISGEAKVCLVPKDSRGPRLISCEPLEIQWVQQGLSRSLVRYIEAHPLTRGYVNFTDQTINQVIALTSSRTGEMATLDLKEASDRVSLRLVCELFPEHLIPALVATRSSHTLLPCGESFPLRKFAPMGSSLCFPIMALTIWAITTACLMRTYSISDPKRICGEVFVYGDDLIIKTTKVADVIKALESVDLRVNKTKSFYTGFFRESCGVDAYKGVEVQPVRIKTVWRSDRDASTFASWVSYSNSLWMRGFYSTANHIARELEKVYGSIPDKGTFPHIPSEVLLKWSSLIARGLKENRKVIDQVITEGGLGFPTFCWERNDAAPVRKRWNSSLQKTQYFVYGIKMKKVKLSSRDTNGWSELLRYLSQGSEEFRAGTYAIPRASMLVRRWR